MALEESVGKRSHQSRQVCGIEITGGQSVSHHLGRGLFRLRVLNDLSDLGSNRRRLSFLGDGRILLSELQTKAPAGPPVAGLVSKEIEIKTEHRP